MHKLKLAAPVVLALAITAVFAVWAFAAVAVGDKAPDFTLKGLNGNTVKLSNYTSKPTMLVFWVSWCPHCQAEVPVIQKVYSDLKGKGMNVVGVTVDENMGDAKDFVSKYKVTFPNAYAGNDDGMKVVDNYDVQGVPTIYIIDKGGSVAHRYVGEMSEDQIRDQFAKLGVK